jgi:hypothetical protein
MTQYKSIWFIEMGLRPIGIVIEYENDKDLITDAKAYIGTGDGISKLEDEIRIAKYGANFPLMIAYSLLPNHVISKQ